MSRGPGRRQRQILETLERFPQGFYLSSLSDNKTEMKALYRAAHKLEAGGKIQIGHYLTRIANQGSPKIVIQKVEP